MASLDRAQAESAIQRALIEHWQIAPADAAPDGAGSPAYGTYAHDLYNLLLRGGSDLQVERHLRGIERDELHHPELGERDLGPVLRSLRSVERAM